MAGASFETLRTVAFGSITGSFAALGTPLANQSLAFRVINTTDQDIEISFDGVNAQLYVVAGTFVLYDVSSDKNPSKNLCIPQHTQVFVKYVSAPSKGTVVFETLYSLIPGY